MHSYFEIFKDRYIGEELTEATKTILEKYTAVQYRKKKHVLIQEGQPHSCVYFVLKGAAKTYYIKDGIEVIISFSLENEMVGSFYNFKGLPSRENIELLEDTTLIAINFKELNNYFATNPQIAAFIRTALEDYALFLEDKLFFSQKRSALDKFDFLLKNSPNLFLRIQLTDIASYLGITRETLSRLRTR